MFGQKAKLNAIYRERCRDQTLVVNALYEHLCDTEDVPRPIEAYVPEELARAARLAWRYGANLKAQGL